MDLELDIFIPKYKYIPEMTDLELNELESLIESVECDINPSVYMEKVLMPKGMIRDDIDQIVKSTGKTMRDTYGIYKDTTDAGATLLRNVYDLVIKLIRGICALIGKSFLLLSKIPAGINAAIDIISNVNEAILAKVKGNIRLNFTKADLEMIYTDGLMGKIQEFVVLANKLMENKTWTGFGQESNFAKKMRDLTMSSTDKKMCYNVIQIAMGLSMIRLEKSVIDLSDPLAKKFYLTNSNMLSFMDGKSNKKFEGSYLKGLQLITEDLDSYKGELINVKDQLESKLNHARNAGQFQAFNIPSQEIVLTTLKMIGGASTTIGKFIHGIREDAKTIENTARKLVSLK